MGFMMAMGSCFGCKKLFSFNPDRVPSFKGEPICRECIDKVNAKRKEMGSPLWLVPVDAYEPQEVA